MPEGVEVKLSAELVSPLVLGKKVKSIETFTTSRYSSEDPEGYKNFQDDISKFPRTVMGVRTKGKFMYWEFDNGWYMFCTFGMSGQWSPQRGKHPCFSFQFDDDSRIYFNDPRHFGTIKFTQYANDLTQKLDDLGWDPLQMQILGNLPWLQFQLAKTSKPIGEVLMDQGVFAGVGNYIRAEALYSCKLSPFRQANTLNSNEIKNLCEAIVEVMEESYKHQGATIQTYKTVYGAEGKYTTLFKVYGKKIDLLGNKIIKQDSGGRTIHWCPTVQV